VRVGETTVELSAMEYALLTRLADEPARVFTKHELLRDVWGFRAQGRTRTVDSHACRLRHKLTASGDARWIENVWGVGYRLAALDPHEREGNAA
jgi:DNA-binding response OmpR family regulator